ncbi:uncharacterized protein LOC144134061 [Amblyomma americanum]
MSGLVDVNCGPKTYSYIKDFLTLRQAVLNLGSFRSEPITLGPLGTPQGAVLSSLIFNLAIKDLLSQLQNIKGVQHAIYTDDIPIWCRTANGAEVEQLLRAAADVFHQ